MSANRFLLTFGSGAIYTSDFLASKLQKLVKLFNLFFQVIQAYLSPSPHSATNVFINKH